MEVDMANSGDDILDACIDAVVAKLAQDEAIVGVSRGVPLYSKNTEIPFVVYVATLDGTGQVAGQKKTVVALVTSNSPHQVRLHDNQLPGISWSPL
jgi:hypothetical protein